MQLKIISLNLWWGGELMPAIIDFLQAETADIVFLQEVHNATGGKFRDRQRSMEILRQLDYPYVEFSQMYLVNSPQGVLPLGNAILSKLPLRPVKDHFFTAGDREIYDDVPEQWPIFPRMMQQVEATTKNGSLNIFNLHGVWDLDGDNFSPQRQTMSQMILDATKDLPNVIVAGDTNAKRTNPAMKALEAHLKPVFGEELKTTFNMRRKENPGYASAAVDLMYVSPEIEILGKACPDVDISDHLPLVVTLDIN